MSKIFNKDSSTLDTIRVMTEKLNKKEKELVAANKRFRVLFDHAPLGIIVTSNRVIVTANSYMYNTLGYTSEELIGKPTRMLYATEDEYQKVGILLTMHQEFSCRVHMIRADGVIKEYTLKVTKISTDENVASIYIEMRE
jgi:PAS domain S-box-containing protein